MKAALQLVRKAFALEFAALSLFLPAREGLQSDIDTINPEQIPLLSQPTLVSGFGVTYARDRRDNPGDATRGTFNTIDVSDAIESLGSSASFFRGFFQNSSFTPLGAHLFSPSVRFAHSGNLRNAVHPAMHASPITSDIPLPERFFAGGGTSLRGFGLNQAGRAIQSRAFRLADWRCSCSIRNCAFR